MTKFYNSYTNQAAPSILNHFGSLEAAIERMSTLFTGQDNLQLYNGQFTYRANALVERSSKSISELFDLFCDLMQTASIQQVELDTSETLKIIDCWTDDPIASGGMSIFDKNALTAKQLAELWTIFKPFDKPIYPQDLSLRYSKKDIKRLITQLKLDQLGKVIFKARENRSRYIGEDFNKSKSQEAVWVHLTLELRRWCLKNGYTTLSYKNRSEDLGSTTYVLLDESALRSTGKVLKFNRDLFTFAVKAEFEKSFNQRFERVQKMRCSSTDFLYANSIAIGFWQ